MASSDFDYTFDELDSEVLDQIDKIDAAHTQASAPGSHNQIASTSKATPQKEPPPTLPTPDSSDSFDDFAFDIDDDVIAQLDNPIAGPSKLTRQTTLDGRILPQTKSSSSVSRPQPERTRTSSNPFGKASNKTKKWDMTAFAKTGLRPKAAARRKRVNREEGDEEFEDEEFEFEQFPAPFVPSDPPPAMKLQPDPEAIKTWKYPLNFPKRDYQFNIVKHSLFENALVALPTGLGKTFIAGVVMLNYYRWFPQGKVIFLGPTKPLVAQQIDACHQVCGIPGDDAIELTGQILPAVRAKKWETKRVFYMTPQTFINDLTKELCDPMDIILVVVDEAHKATGDYAYSQVVRYLMAKNPHFRLLALTATPGSNAEGVQAVIDSLHISHIEIRDHSSLDLRQYIHEKSIELSVIPMTGSINKIKEPLLKTMEAILEPLQRQGILRVGDVAKLHPYRCLKVIQEVHAKPDLKKNAGWAVPALRTLSSLARALSYLMEETLEMAYRSLQDLHNGGKTAAGKPSKSKLNTDPNFKLMLAELDIQRNSGDFLHPKMDKLKTIVVQHFAKAQLDEGDAAEAAGPAAIAPRNKGTRAIVFATFRDVVEEIVEMLNQERPLINATRFIGQSSDKSGKKGFAQKDQIEVIKQFKEGKFNVLVSTSIGEEGLDIGEVDLIVCYESPKAPVRMLQRIGRTGRKRDGRVEVLLAEGREDDNWQTSQDKHKDVQDSIIKGDQLELYGDVKRLIPADVKPTCKEEVMEIQPYVRDEKGKQKETRAAVASGKGKRKRDADPKRNMPEGAILGFLTAKALVPKGKGKKKAMELDLGAIMAEDDDDKDLETPLVVSPSASPVKKRRLSPAAAKTTAPSRKSSVLKKTPSVSKPKTSTPLITGTQLARKLEDDSDDVQIEAGVRFGTPVSGSSAQSQLPSTSPEIPLSKWSEQSRRGSILSSAEADPSSRSRGSPGRGKLLSPVQETDYGTMDLEFDDIEYLGEASPSKNASIEMPIDISDDDDDDEPKFLGARSVSNSPAKGSNGELSFSNSPMSHVPKGSMPPPANPRTSSPSFQSSFPVRAPGQRSKTASFVAALAASGQLPPSSQRQLACQVPQSSSPAPSPPRQRQRQDKGKGKARIPNPYLDEEVEVSGSDQPGEGGHSDTDGGSENEEDRRFIAENPTQAPKGYNQTAAYRQSLFTQAAKNMNFKSGPVRVGAFGTGGRRAGPPPRGHPSSGAPDESLDEYETGSFVADDEEEVQYLGTSSEA